MFASAVPARRPGWLLFASGLAILALGIGIYLPSLQNQFALDDLYLARSVLPSGAPNAMTGELLPVGRYFDAGYWEGNGGEQRRLFRPVTILSFALTNHLAAPAGDPEAEASLHHGVNVALYGWAVLLALVLAWRLLRHRLATVCVGVLFATHGVHSEVVASIIGRAELFAFCFGAAAVLLFETGLRRQGPAREVRFVAAVILMFGAYCSKESAVAWAPFLFCFVWATRSVERAPGEAEAMPGSPDRGLLRADCLVPGLLVSGLPLAGFLVLRHLALGPAEHAAPISYFANPLVTLPEIERICTALRIWGYGLWKCVLPLDLASDYGPTTFALQESPADPGVWASAIVLLALGCVGVFGLRRAPAVAAGALVFLLFSVITANVLFAVGTVFGERLYFTPSLGIALILGGCIARTPGSWALVPVILWGGWNVWLVLDRNPVWHDEDARIARDADLRPRCASLQDQRALQLEAAGDAAAAEARWRQSLQAEPEFADALCNLASLLLRSGRADEAEALLQRALQVPEHKAPRRHLTRSALAALYSNTGREAECLEQLRAVWGEPGAVEDADVLLPAAIQKLPTANLEEILQRGERRRPGAPEWDLLRSALAQRQRQPAAAVESLRAALRKRPWHAPTRLQLASVLLATGSPFEASGLLMGLRDDRFAPAAIREEAARLLR